MRCNERIYRPSLAMQWLSEKWDYLHQKRHIWDKSGQWFTIKNKKAASTKKTQSILVKEQKVKVVISEWETKFKQLEQRVIELEMKKKELQMCWKQESDAHETENSN